MENIFIDLTSKNNQYVCVESQGSWLFHRFGKRKIDNEELNFSVLKKYLKKESPKQITLYSILGDPMEYSRILDLLHFCKRSDIVVNINTNGFSKKIEKTLGHNIEFCFKIYGYKDTLDIIIPDVDNNLYKNLDLDFKCRPRIQYMLYQHNLHDVINVIELCEKKGIALELHPGVCVYNDLNHIITQEGKWLYDIKGIDEQEFNCLYTSYTDFTDLKEIFKEYKKDNVNLIQSNEGYHLLKNYVKDTGLSINEVLLPNINCTEEYNHQECISYKGHLFNSIEKMTIVSNSYVPDWLPDKFDTLNPYQSNIFNILCEFANSDKDTIESLL